MKMMQDWDLATGRPRQPDAKGQVSHPAAII